MKEENNVRSKEVFKQNFSYRFICCIFYVSKGDFGEGRNWNNSEELGKMLRVRIIKLWGE